MQLTILILTAFIFFLNFFLKKLPQTLAITNEMIKLAKDKNYLFLSDMLQALKDNKEEDDQYSALHYATVLEDKDIIQALLDRGADVNIQDEFGVTPLM